MAKALRQCLSCRKVSRFVVRCPYCDGTEGSYRKSCKGMLHPPGGADVPLGRFSIYKSGVLEGRPLAKCKKCRSIERRSSAPVDVYWPFLKFLKENGLDQREIARRIGAQENSVSDWQLKKRKWMQAAYFRKLFSLTQEVSREMRQQKAQARSDGLNSQVPVP